MRDPVAIPSHLIDLVNEVRFLILEHVENSDGNVPIPGVVESHHSSKLLKADSNELRSNRSIRELYCPTIVQRSAGAFAGSEQQEEEFLERRHDNSP